MSIDVSALTDTMFTTANAMFATMIPIIGLSSGITLGFGLGNKVMQAIRTAVA